MASDSTAGLTICGDELDRTSDGAVELRINEALADLELHYAGLEGSGILLLETKSSKVDDLSDDELTAKIKTALDERGLLQDLRLSGYRVASNAA